MRIGQIATVGMPVRQRATGSIESTVWLLTRELQRLGHEVTVFAAPGSSVAGTLVAAVPGTYGSSGAPDDWQLCEWMNLCEAVRQSQHFDVLHSHAYLWSLPLSSVSRAPIIHTLHTSPHVDDARLRALYPEALVTAISHYQWSAFSQLPAAPVIHHAVDDTQFTFRADPDDYVCFLGRFIDGKGPLQAIAVARQIGMRLVLAGSRNAYYEQHIAPHVDGRAVEYAGAVSGDARDRLLGGARALLYPQQAPEPFGLVMAEAMICGTPVAAIRVGAVPEVVDEGLTGCCAPSMETLPEAVLRACTLDRTAVRARALSRFSPERMARDYVKQYERSVCADRRIDDSRPVCP